ncbi:hypothetical protein J2X76_006130 [Neorhizobium sp. 2083]|uniref:hypothetical protein n=1 Tax=Neorhizobium sp. 2083 TaxID=2817762 RepID=UPI00286058AF|nr:hypothetical protein [Neorhizobium sp. 2083]MDR6820930.1 hypothetical protein [Neorhizobium sp. 2083]
MSRFWKIETWIVQTLCVLALLFLGLAHQPPVLASDARAAEFADFVLPDGTLPTLCVTSTEDGGKGSSSPHKAHSQGCEACRINAAVILPGPTDTGGIWVGVASVTELPLRVETIHRQIYPPNTGPRAPPLDPAVV